MPYIAELSINNRKLMLGTREAPDDDANALQSFEKWALEEAEIAGAVVHLQVLQNGQPVLSKKYGEKNVIS